MPPTTLSAGAQPSTSTTSSIGCIQFPPGTALGSQLASAALLGRTLPTAGAQPLPMKVTIISAFIHFLMKIEKTHFKQCVEVPIIFDVWLSICYGFTSFRQRFY